MNNVNFFGQKLDSVMFSPVYEAWLLLRTSVCDLYDSLQWTPGMAIKNKNSCHYFWLLFAVFASQQSNFFAG